MLRRATSATLLFLLLGGPALAVEPRPAVADEELFFKSLEAAAKAVEQFGAPRDEATLARINAIGYRIARHSGFDKYPFSFYLIDLPEPNAFALPGGQIFVTRGMLDVGLSDDALAALLGHEIGHVVHQHGVRMQRRATLLNVLSQAVMIGVMLQTHRTGPSYSPVPDPYGIERLDRGGDLVQGAFAAGMIVSELLLRSYSREFEDEADEEGQRLAAAAGFAPDGAARLMAQLGSRLPQSREYGYWRTHPFFDDRLRSAEARGTELRRLEPRPDDEFRQRTQARLLALAASPKAGAETRELIAQAALSAWPVGTEAEGLRRTKLHAQRDAELGKAPLARRYGEVVAAYATQLALVGALTPDSPFLGELAREKAALEREAAGIYPQALAVWQSGVYETPFLETFLVNYPEAEIAPEVALVLGESYSRLGRQTEAVEKLLRVRELAPEGPLAARAHQLLAGLVPRLDRLAALGELTDERVEPELREAAGRRLAELAGSYADIADGAEYLRRFPMGAEEEKVRARLDRLAMDLYGEVVLYQGIGDSVRALDRIHRILTHAPASPAADRLREKIVVDS